MLISNLAVISVLFHLNGPDVGMLTFLQDHDRISLLGRFGGTENGADIQVCVILHLLGMNDQANVDIFFGSKSPQIANHPILEVEFLDALGLGAEHELQIIDTNKFDIICINSVLQTLHHFPHVCRSIKVQKVQWVLSKFLETLLGQILIFFIQF